MKIQLSEEQYRVLVERSKKDNLFNKEDNYKDIRDIISNYTSLNDLAKDNKNLYNRIRTRTPELLDNLERDGGSLTKWNLDNFGPVYIPKKGVTVALNTESLPFYKKIIGEYENNELKVNGSEIRINGKIATSYTFNQNYYWMMGDNRHNSLDARYFGYTPEDHIVGKPVFIWMRLDPNGKGLNKIRWDRMFTTVSGDGQPQSYFKFFLFALIAYFGISYFVRKRKEKKN